jgi:hypothetical protein
MVFCGIVTMNHGPITKTPKGYETSDCYFGGRWQMKRSPYRQYL